MSNPTTPETLVLPTLYKLGSTGAEQQWTIKVVPTEDGFANIVTEYGQIEGTKQTASDTVKEGKNPGKKNATTAYQQACSQANSTWKKKLKDGYSETRGGGDISMKPMLAKKYKEEKKKVTFPCYVQPKLDGVRCLAKRTGDSILLVSREGNEHKGLEHIREGLLLVMPDGATWDGELYIHLTHTFQEILSLIKKPCEESKKLEYHVYDQMSDDPFEIRSYCIAQCLDPVGTDTGKEHIPAEAMCIVPVSTLSANSHEEIESRFSEYILDGYEGAIIRWGDFPYVRLYNHVSLLKFKEFMDDEFDIVDVVPGTGKDVLAGTFVCKTKEGYQFNARPKGSHSLRASYLFAKELVIGKKLTVRYFGLTTTTQPVPRMPVGIAVRDYE